MLFADVIPGRSVGPALGESLMGPNIMGVLGQQFGQVTQAIAEREPRGVNRCWFVSHAMIPLCGAGHQSMRGIDVPLPSWKGATQMT